MLLCVLACCMLLGARTQHARLEYCARLVVDGDGDPKYVCYISMPTHGLARFLSLNFASPHVCPINGPYILDPK
jgi:hypothetical protein